MSLTKEQTLELYKAIENVATAHKALDEIKAKYKNGPPIFYREQEELEIQNDMSQRLIDEETT